MIKKVTAFMQKHHMIDSGDHICAGISGGADSVCLFLLLESLRQSMGFTLSVVHIEHGIRGEESLADMHFVKQLAEKYEIPYTCYAYAVEEIAKKEGLTVEEAGRKVRYEAFYQEGKKYVQPAEKNGGTVKIAVAHHGDDNAETLLFHMCRGSGIEGIAGIRPVRGQIIRPLLCVTRQEIEEFLAESGQKYCIDATNTDVIYSRNRIRNRIMPEMEMVNKQAVMHMNSLMEDMAEISDYLNGLVQKIIKDSVKKEKRGISFPTDGLSKYPKVIQNRIMLALIAKVSGSRKDISREHAYALSELAEGNVGRKIDLPYGITAEKTYKKIVLYAKQESQEKHMIYQRYLDIPEMPDVWQEIASPTGKFLYRIFFLNKKCVKIPKNPYTKWFDYDKIKNSLCFRTRQPGDYLVTDTKGHRQKLKEYFINEKVPKAEREQILLLAEESHILWIVGGRISEQYKITENTKIILEVQFVEEEQ